METTSLAFPDRLTPLGNGWESEGPTHTVGKVFSRSTTLTLSATARNLPLRFCGLLNLKTFCTLRRRQIPWASENGRRRRPLSSQNTSPHPARSSGSDWRLVVAPLGCPGTQKLMPSLCDEPAQESSIDTLHFIFAILRACGLLPNHHRVTLHAC